MSPIHPQPEVDRTAISFCLSHADPGSRRLPELPAGEGPARTASSAPVSTVFRVRGGSSRTARRRAGPSRAGPERSCPTGPRTPISVGEEERKIACPLISAANAPRRTMPVCGCVRPREHDLLIGRDSSRPAGDLARPEIPVLQPLHPAFRTAGSLLHSLERSILYGRSSIRRLNACRPTSWFVSLLACSGGSWCSGNDGQDPATARRRPSRESLGSRVPTSSFRWQTDLAGRAHPMCCQPDRAQTAPLARRRIDPPDGCRSLQPPPNVVSTWPRNPSRNREPRPRTADVGLVPQEFAGSLPDLIVFGGKQTDQ